MNDFGTEYAQIYKAFVEAWRSYFEQTQALGAQERALFRPNAAGFTPSPAIWYEDRQFQFVLGKRADQIFRIMIREAEALFSPVGATLRINASLYRGDYLDRYEETTHGRREAKWQEFDPDALWQRLTKDYGGQAGTDEARRQCAKALISGFDIRSGEPMRFRGNRLVLQTQIWVDDYDKKNYKINKLDIRCTEYLGKAIRALSSAAGFIGETPLHHQLDAFANKYARYGYQFESRERHDLPGVRVVFYLSRVEFTFSPTLSQKLPVFIAQWAGDALSNAA